MKPPKRDPVREDRIYNEAIVDARPEEQAMSWYYYLEGKISFPFQARCVAANSVSPLRQGRNHRGLSHGCRGCLRARHVCADPLAGAEDGRSSLPTGRHRSRRINQGSHRRLALLGRARLPSLISCPKLINGLPANKPRCLWQSANRDRNQAWTDIKAKLASFDRNGLLDLIHDLYAAHKDNRTFLHARFGVSGDTLRPYKEILDRWLWPDVLRNQDTSVAKAKQAISSYRKAVAEPAGVAELMVFYCERAAGFCNDVGNQDEVYFDALVRMFEHALKVIVQLPAPDRNALIARLDRVRVISHNFGYGVGDDMDSLLATRPRN